MNTEDPSDILGMLDSIEEAIQAAQWISPPVPPETSVHRDPVEPQALQIPASPSLLADLPRAPEEPPVPSGIVSRNTLAINLPVELCKYPDPPPRRLGAPTVRGSTAKVLSSFRWSGT